MSDIELDLTDYKTILRHRGRILGESSSCNINDFINSIDKTIKESIKDAKGILISFGIHKDQTLFAINDMMSSIHDNINTEAEIIFDTETISGDDKDEVTYQIIITGL